MSFNLCIFCGSSSPKNENISRLVSELIEAMLNKKTDLKLVYGGANIGLMGLVAEKFLENDRTVVGVMPSFLKDFDKDINFFTTSDSFAIHHWKVTWMQDSYKAHISKKIYLKLLFCNDNYYRLINLMTDINCLILRTICIYNCINKAISSYLKLCTFVFATQLLIKK